MFGMAAIVPGCPTLCRHGSGDLAPRALLRIDLQFIVRPIHRVRCFVRKASFPLCLGEQPAPRMRRPDRGTFQNFSF